MMATTHPEAPYDVLRPLRCRAKRDGKFCGKIEQNINWHVPNIYDWRCKACHANNVVCVVHAEPSSDPVSE